MSVFMSEQLEKLKKQVAGKPGILGFFEDYRFLSNFHPVKIEYEGLIYPSTENAFQAAKTLDLVKREEFLSLEPNKAKWLGRKVQLRNDWEQVKDSVMETVVREKFSQGELKDKLLATGDLYLEETNWWKDIYWGVCDGVGENKLGKILMKVRKELQES